MTDYDYGQSLAPTRYRDQHFRREAVKILPGEYYVTTRDMLIVTVLGSCVSVCLRDRENGICGMNHFMLPGNSDGDAGPISRSARYGSYAMDILVNHLLKLGAERRRLEAKIFGGGCVMAGLTVNHIGERNAAFVLDYLHREEISISAQDLFDIYPRKIYCFPAAGRVLVRKLKTQHSGAIVDCETAYRRKLAAVNVAEVGLFERAFI